MYRKIKLFVLVILFALFILFMHNKGYACETPVAGISVDIEKVRNSDNGYDYVVCPLNADIQEYIIDRCEEMEINPRLVISLIAHESKFDINAKGYNSNGTVDRGLAQINSRYEDYYEDRYNREFDPYDPYDAVDFIILKFNDDREFWSRRGINGVELTYCILGGYNMGRGTFLYDYVLKGKYKCGYATKVMKAL